VTKFVSALIVLAMLALPGQALAQGSGGDVYTEDPPVAGNDDPPNGNNGGNDGGSSVPSGTQSEDSAAAADLAESTDPDGDGSSAGGSSGSGSGNDGSGSSGAETSSGSSAGVDDVVGEIAGGSDDGAGILLPMILGAVLVAGVAFVVIRRRGGSPGTA